VPEWGTGAIVSDKLDDRSREGTGCANRFRAGLLSSAGCGPGALRVVVSSGADSKAQVPVSRGCVPNVGEALAVAASGTAPVWPRRGISR
jgi:hypothetical protein